MERGWIHLNRVTKRYQQGSATCTALQGIDLDLPQGTFAAIVGPSGSGKTTLLNLVTGIDRASEGEVWVGEYCLNRLSEEELARWRGRYVGIVFQFFQLIPTLTALENVQLPLELYPQHPAGRRRKIAWEALEQVGLAERAHHLPSQLSGGEQQRVALARALVHDPWLIAADEPTGNLDSTSGQQVLELLGAIHRRGKTVLLVTHDRDLAAVASCEILLRDGRIVAVEQRQMDREKEARCASESWPSGAE